MMIGAIEANQPHSVISMNAQLIDEVQKYLEPNLDCDKLQKELEKKARAKAYYEANREKIKAK